MPRAIVWFLALLCLFTFRTIAATPPQDQYLQLYLLLQDGERLENDGQKASAYTRYDEFRKRLQALKDNNPDWEPTMVNYRLKYVKEKLAQLEGAKDAHPAADATPASDPSATSNSAATTSTNTPSTTPPPTPSLSTNPADDHSEDPSVLKGKIASLEKDLSETKQKLSEAMAESAQLRAKLDITEKQLAAARSGTVDEKVASLLQENNALKAQLSKAEDQIKQMQSGTGDVAILQVQLKKVQDELALQERENQAFRQTTAELKQQLETAQKQLADASQQAGSAQNPGSFSRENEILRGIINRQLQEQARRDAAKRLAAEELDNLKIKSEVLRQQIDILGSPLVALSAEELALLRGPGTENVISPSNSFSAPLATNNSTNAPSATPPAADSTPAPAASNNSDNSTAASNTTATPAPGTNATTTSDEGADSKDYKNRARVPDDMRPLAQEASDLFAQKRYDDASAKYQEMITHYPESLYAWSNLGVVRFQQQNYPEAEKALQQAVKLAPQDGFSHSVLGIVYYQMGKFDDAVSTLTRAAALDPNNPKTHNYLGIACSQKGWQEAAEQECRKAIELDPGYGDAHFNLAVIYATQKPPSKELAKRHYQKAVDLGIPKDPQLEKLLQ